MAASPTWKVYNAAKEYRAACKDVAEAAVLVAFLGDGATIRCEHTRIVWTEGAEDQPASESYDHVAEVAHRRRTPRSEWPRAAVDQRCADCGSSTTETGACSVPCGA